MGLEMRCSPSFARERRRPRRGEFQIGDSFGPVRPRLLLPVEAGNEATAASFGTRLTRMRRPAWPCFDCGGLITSGQERQTFNSVPFCSISFHSLSSTRGRNARFPSSRERRQDSRERRIRCSSQRGYDVMGSCRWFVGWAYVWGGVTLGPFANGPYIQTGGSCRWFGGWGVRLGWHDVRAGRGPGCEIPACAGTTAGSRGMTRGLTVG